MPAGKSRPTAILKEPPPLPCLAKPLNMYCYMWNSPRGFRLPVKACRPPPGSLRDRLTYGSRIASNHEQGREIILSKDQSGSLSLPELSFAPFGKFLKDFFYKNFPFRITKTCVRRPPGAKIKSLPLPCATVLVNCGSRGTGRTVFDDQ